MKLRISTYERSLTGIFIALAASGALLWLISERFSRFGIPILFFGLIGFLVHDFIPLISRSFAAKPAVRPAPVATSRLRELVWAEHGKTLSAIGVLFHSYIKFYPRWIGRRSDYYVPSMVTDAAAFSDNRIRISLLSREYLFSFTPAAIAELDPNVLDRGLLELFTNNEKILGLHMIEEQSEAGPFWRVMGLETYIEGPWLNDFKRLIEKIASDIEDRRRDEHQA